MSAGAGVVVVVVVVEVVVIVVDLTVDVLSGDEVEPAVEGAGGRVASEVDVDVEVLRATPSAVVATAGAVDAESFAHASTATSVNATTTNHRSRRGSASAMPRR